jgi:hypothetical protein
VRVAAHGAGTEADAGVAIAELGGNRSGSNAGALVAPATASEGYEIQRQAG